MFVTGASGFLGRRLVPRLREAGCEVVALLLPEEAVPPVLAGARIVRGDVTRPDGLAEAAAGCHAVVHLAARVGYGQRLDACRRVNRDGTAHVAAAAARVGVRRFLHLSSVSVYGRAAGRALDEGAPMRRTGDPYGDTKIDAEEIVAAHAARGELAPTVLRPTVVYGPGDTRFLPRLAANLRSGRARIVGGGANRVDAIHVDDAVEAMFRALASPDAVGRVYNLNHPGNPSWRELVAEVARLLGVPAPRGSWPYPVALVAAALVEAGARLRGREPRITRYAVRVIGRPYDYRVERIRDELGFAPRVPMLEGVRRFFAAPDAS